MTKDQFRALEEISGSRSPSHSKAGDSKADNLLGAAIAAFAGITRPGRHDLQQFEDLVMPLLHCASAPAKQHAAHRLAKLEDAPRRVILALADEPVAISAPILLRSPILRPGDLIDLIGKNGLPHARAIARRQSGDVLLQAVLRSFADPTIDRTLALQESLADFDASSAGQADATIEDSFLDNRRLIETALQKQDYFFRNALAGALGLTFEQANALIGSWPNSPLPIVLKALGLTPAECFLVVTAVLGPVATDRAGLLAFVELYRSIDAEKAMMLIRQWNAGTMSAILRSKLVEMAEAEDDIPLEEAANSDAPPLLTRMAK